MQRHALWIVPVLCTALAAWVGVAEGVHEMHNGDTFVPALTSLQEWTFFYWQQNRYGMLIPALTRPLDDPLAVLVAQLVISSAFGLLAFFAVARAALGRDGRWLAAGALGAALFVDLPGERDVFGYLGMFQPAGTSLALSAGALALWWDEGRPGPARRVSAFVAAALALWVNLAAIGFLAPALAAERILRRRGGEPPRGWHAEAATAVAFAALFAATTLYPWGHDYTALLPPHRWLPHAAEFAAAVWKAYLKYDLAIALVLGAGATAFAARGSGAAGRRAAALAVGAFAYLAVFAVHPWTKGIPRYAFLPLAVLAPLVVALPAERWLPRTGRRALVAEALTLVLLVAAVGDRFGNPAPGRVGAEVDRRFGERTPELLASGAGLVVGDYWNVWPMVFHANRVLHARGEAREVFGLTHRAWPTRARWEPLFRCGAVLAASHGDRKLDWLERAGLLEGGRRVEIVAEGATVDRLRVVCDAASGPVEGPDATR